MNDLGDFDFYSTYAYTYCARHLEEDGWSKQKWSQATDLYKKKLKAIEIIKEKKIDMYKLQDCFDFKLSNKKHIHKCIHGNMILEEEIGESDATEYYNKGFDISYQITPEEFDLLKESVKEYE